MKYSVYGVISATKELGIFEANSKEEAEEMARKEANVSLCSQCSYEVERPKIHILVAQEVLEEVIK